MFFLLFHFLFGGGSFTSSESSLSTGWLVRNSQAKIYNCYATGDVMGIGDRVGDTGDEYMLEDIFPARALENSLLMGTYPVPSFPYRYLYQDTTGFAAAFASGHYLQFLPGITVTSTGAIIFEGSSSSNTRLFTRGNTGRGVRIYNGAIKMSANGSIKLN